MSEFKLDALIREALEKSQEPDLHVVARRLVSRIPLEEREAVLARCLYDRVRIVNTQVRMTAGSPMAASSTPQPGRSRWARMAPALKVRYPVVGKILADCTAEDCEAIALDYANRAAAFTELEDRFRSLASRLRSVGASTVAGLHDVQLEVAA